MTYMSMSTPRGKRIHRLMHDVAKEVFAGTDLRARIDFSKRGGHQAMVILRGDQIVARVGMVSTPRDETNAVKFFRERLEKARVKIEEEHAA